MTKTIRPTQHKDMSLGILLIIFAIVFFLSGQLFTKNQPDLGFINIYFAEFLVSLAVLVMILILWEEILFPVKIRPVDGGMMYRNHPTKLRMQAVMYLVIPAIIVFLYLTFNVNGFRFFAWAGVTLILPVIGKLVSGINNFHDFLILTTHGIEFKDNEHEGKFQLNDIKSLEMIKEEGELHQLRLELSNADPVTIEIHQMELEAFYESIEEYITDNYLKLLK